MLTSVAGDPAAIGYVSMGSLNETVKAVSVDGNAATVEGIKDGSYTLARPFVVTTYARSARSPRTCSTTSCPLKVRPSSTRKATSPSTTLPRPTPPLACPARSPWRLLFRDPRHGEAGRGLHALNPDVTVVVQQSDSTTGVTGTIEGTVDLGMASRASRLRKRSRASSAPPSPWTASRDRQPRERHREPHHRADHEHLHRRHHRLERAGRVSCPTLTGQ